MCGASTSCGLEHPRKPYVPAARAAALSRGLSAVRRGRALAPREQGLCVVVTDVDAIRVLLSHHSELDHLEMSADHGFAWRPRRASIGRRHKPVLNARA